MAELNDEIGWNNGFPGVELNPEGIRNAIATNSQEC